MDQALMELLTQTVLHEPLLGRDVYGQPTYGPATARPARIEQRMQTVIGPSGPQLVPVTRLYVTGEFAIGQSDRMTLPDGGQAPIRGIETVLDVDGSVAHKVVYF